MRPWAMQSRTKRNHGERALRNKSRYSRSALSGIHVLFRPPSMFFCNQRRRDHSLRASRRKSPRIRSANSSALLATVSPNPCNDGLNLRRRRFKLLHSPKSESHRLGLSNWFSGVHLLPGSPPNERTGSSVLERLVEVTLLVVGNLARIPRLNEQSERASDLRCIQRHIRNLQSVNIGQNWRAILR